MKPQAIDSSAYPELDWAGSIPSHWVIKKLGFVISLRSGEGIDSKVIQESGEYPVYGGNGLRGYTSGFTHEGELLLVGRQGALCGNINYASGQFWATEHALVASPREPFSTQWLGSLLGAMNLNQYSVSAAQPGLAAEAISQLRIPFPPIKEQRAIAEYLDRETKRLDELVRAKEGLLELVAEKRRALITRAVTRGLNPKSPLRDSGVEWLGAIPEEWATRRVKYLFSLITDAAPEDNDFELLALYTDIGVKPRKELEARGNNSTTTDNYWIVKSGDLVVNKLLAWMGAFGVSEYEGVTSPAYDILRGNAEVEPMYYHHLFRCGICFPEFRRRSYGIMDMRLRLYFERFGDMPVPFPPLAEQRAIVAYIATETAKLDALRSSAERTIRLLKERRSALISAAVTGKITIP
jgi:type I restriction enzyme, S subunit